MPLNLNREPDLPPQLKWKCAHEPKLLGWTIRARNYNTFVANCMFAFMAVATTGGAYTVYLHPVPGAEHITQLAISVGFYMLITLTTSSMTHQRMNFAYRFTKSGIEYCEWKEFPQ